MSEFSIFGFVRNTDGDVTDIIGRRVGEDLELFYDNAPFDIGGVYGMGKLLLTPIEDYETMKSTLVSIMDNAGGIGVLHVSPKEGYIVKDIDTFESHHFIMDPLMGCQVQSDYEEGDVCTLEVGDDDYDDVSAAIYERDWTTTI
jgi:hypothetical protein